MNIIYTWIINKMDCYPEHNGETNVVFKVNWGLTGSDESTGIGYTGYVTESVDLSYEVGNTFTPYNELTQEQVIGWVKVALGEEKITELESTVATQILKQMNPPIVTPSLPWSQGN